MKSLFSARRNTRRTLPRPGPRRLAVEALEDRCLLSTAPFAVVGTPRSDPADARTVDPLDFRVTTFASGLNYPEGMVQLADGSLLVATSRPLGTGASFFNSAGDLLRFVDADRDGVADGPGTALFSGLPGGLT